MTQTADDRQLTRALHHYFGYDHFRDGQLAVLRSIMAGQDTLAVLPTGAGKTLLYQLPAYLTNRLVVVVSPLISLMQDQVDRLHARGEKRVVMLSSQLSGHARTVVLKNLGAYRFVFASPEILVNPRVLSSVRRAHPGFFVIDEAHCISQWGPDFRPQYLLLKQVIDRLGHPPVLMLTATATPEVRSDILSKLGLDGSEVNQVIRSVNRPNIFLAAQSFGTEQAKRRGLLSLLKQLGGQGIVYASSRRTATDLATWISQQAGLAAAAYHGGIDALDRYRLQQSFMHNELDLICATSAFGMGIDKDDVRYVIHYQVPGSLESYVQEVGRAGRDGQPSLGILLNSPGDFSLQQNLHHIDLPPVDLLDQIKNHQANPKILGDRRDLIMFYLNHGYSGQDVLNLFKKRERLASQKLAVLSDYLQTDSCRHDFIAHYFGEGPIDTHPSFCCDCDQTDWQVAEIVKKQRATSKNVHGLDWSSRIKAVFNLD